MKFLTATALICLAFSAQAQSSKDNPRLQDALERFPKADAKYYELTIAETDKFLIGLGWLENKAEAR